MVYDPLFDFINNLMTPWWWLWIIYGSLFVFISAGFLYATGGSKRLTNEYFKDPLGTFLWPYLVVGPILTAFILIGQTTTNISDNLRNIGENFNTYSLGLSKLKIFFWIAVTISTVSGIETVIRYRKLRPKLWLNHPRILHPIMIVIFNIPMGIMVIMSIIRLIDQWTVIHNFLSSGWLPTSPFHFDQMYGVKWLYKIIIRQISLVVFVSFGSLVILIREGAQTYSWRYKTVFFLSIITLSIVAVIQVYDMNFMLETIHSKFLSIYTSGIDKVIPFSLKADTSILLIQILLANKVNYLSTLPTSIPIPNWLTNIIGIRLLLLVFELYGLIARYLGWKAVPKAMGDLLKRLA